MVKINLKDKKLFGNDAGEDEDLDVLNSYYIDHPDFDDFFDKDECLSIVSARKGMGKSALLSRLEHKLLNDVQYNSPIVIRVKGADLIGLGQFSGEDHSYLENYWKQIICKKIIVEIGNKIGLTLNSNEMSMIEISEIDGLKSKGILNGLLSRVKGVIPGLGFEIKNSIPENFASLLDNYQRDNENAKVWILIDDIDAKYKNSPENQAKVGAFFSAIRSLAFEQKNLIIRTSVRSDVWSSLRHLEDLDKLQQYIITIFWSKKYMRDMLAQKILIYIIRKYPDSPEAKYKLKSDYNKILDLALDSPILWHGYEDAKLFDAVSAFSNRRPRWMGQLCRMAGKKASEAKYSKKITLDHFNYILSDYGANRRDDLIKEHSHQFEELSHLIDSLRATNREFTYEELDFVINENFIRGRKKEDIPKVDGKIYSENEDIADFLFKLGLISRIHDDKKTFTHFTDDPDLYKSVENRSNRITWSIHPAYRSFLNIY
tara:strand:+ start:4350 stop:5810 length:1461 start_codon:yes stop_codon:yes gene_type:complete